jgi:hypothetical protein
MALNVLNYGAYEEKFWETNFLEQFGNYKRQTTFYSDLSLAEWTSGIDGIKDTFKKVMKSWGKNLKYITEFVMCLNHKAWEFADKDFLSRQNRLLWVTTEQQKDELACLYTELYEQAYAEVENTFKDDSESLSYFYDVLD